MSDNGCDAGVEGGYWWCYDREQSKLLIVSIRGGWCDYCGSLYTDSITDADWLARFELIERVAEPANNRLTLGAGIND